MERGCRVEKGFYFETPWILLYTSYRDPIRKVKTRKKRVILPTVASKSNPDGIRLYPRENTEETITFSVLSCDNIRSRTHSSPTCSRGLIRHSPGCQRRAAVIDSQLPPVHFLVIQQVISLLRTRNIDEFSMSESSGLSSFPIDSDSDINNVVDFSEQFIEIFIGHLERHITDEQCLGRGVAGSGVSGSSLWPCSLLDGVLHCQSAAFEDLLVKALNRLCALINVVELYITKPSARMS